jgi:hypothetical protein
MNYLVEIKNEYTITLVNILTPLIFQGLNSLYVEAKRISDKDNTLKNFQTFLRGVPRWNNQLISDETDRILSNCKCADWLNDLIKAVIKSNIMILTNNKNINNIDTKYYEEIDFKNFIHKIYIECAREVWNNPYLFFDEYTPIELKRNQRDAISLIKDAIKEAIRKMLPVKHILKEYLGNTFVKETYDNFEESISEANGKNIKNMLQHDLTNKAVFDDNNKAVFDDNNKAVFNDNNKADIDKEILNVQEDIVKSPSPINLEVNNNIKIPAFSMTSEEEQYFEQEGGNKTPILDQILENHRHTGGSLEEMKNMNKEDIINQLKVEEVIKQRESIGSKKSSYDPTSAEETTLIKEELEKSLKQSGGNPNEENIKSILENELYNNVSDDSDTSISYTHGNFNDESFEDVFSNVNGDKKERNNNEIASIASEIFLNNLLQDDHSPNKRKSKKEFFQNYMKV